jgi:rod shape-determining protein MreC
MSPVINVFNQSYFVIKEFVGDVGLAIKTNKQLKKELERLVFYEKDYKILKSKLLEQEQIIKQLGEIAHFDPPSKADFVTACVLGAPVDVYLSHILIQNSSEKKLEKNMVVICVNGLVGRIIDNYGDISRVMLITDELSRVPVKISSTKEHAILSGNGSSDLLITNLEMDVNESKITDLKVGDELITSGAGGVYPPGIPVAKIYSIDGIKIIAKPIVDISNEHFVMVLIQPCYQHIE